MKMTSLILSAAALGMIAVGTASAEVEEVRTYESKVVSVPPPDTTTTTYSYKIYGPDHSEYVVQGPPSEVARLADEVRSNPNAVVRFQGDFVDGPQKVFQLKKWESNTSEHTDMWGNKTSTTTTTTTENR